MFKIRFPHAVMPALFAGLLQACVTLPAYSPVMGADEQTAKGDAILYGSFQFNNNVSMPVGANLGVSITCSDGNTYAIRFTHAQAIQAISIRPATCRFSEMLYQSKTSAYSPAVIQRIEAREGGAYYIGSYMGQVESRPNSVDVVRYRIQDLGIFSASFENTTKAFREKYPALRDIPVYNPNPR